MQIIECPHCGTRVVPLADGNCPSCRKDIRTAPDPIQKNSNPVSAWDSFQASLRPAVVSSSASPLAEVLRIEAEMLGIRTTAISQLKQESSADPAASEKIRAQVIPVFHDALNLSTGESLAAKDDAAELTNEARNFLQRRLDCWLVLAAALDEHDLLQLSRHEELWEQSEKERIDLQAASSSVANPRTKPEPAQLAQDFTRALATFTPRLVTVPAIITINFLVFIVMVQSGVDAVAPSGEVLVSWGANFAPRTMNGEWWRLFTNVFLHYGIFHLAMNMWVLWDFGQLVERLVGNMGFLVLYLVSGLAGSVASLAWNDSVASAGASGAVFGVAGALCGLAAFRRDTIPAEVLMHLRNTVVCFIGFNIYYGLKTAGIDHAAHVGGFLAGIVCGLLLSQPLSLAMLPYRGRRNLITAVVGIVGILIAIIALPTAPIDVAAELTKVSSIEERVLKIHGQLFDDARAERISDQQIADTIHQKILPPWSEAIGQVKKLADSSVANREMMQRILEYMNLREAAWRSYAEAARSDDPQKIESANQQWQAADAAAGKIPNQ